MRKFVSMVSMFVLMWLFFGGYMMVDNGWNMKTIENTYGDEWCDWALTNVVCRTPSESYQTGLLLITTSMWFMIVIVLFNTLVKFDKGGKV